jgi:hypothetical protein
MPTILVVVVCLALMGLGRGAAVSHAAGAAFPVRGIVHTPYGSKWSHAERMDMVRWMAAHGMNTFVYIPQEDPHTRERWREPFPDDAMAEFAEEIELARSLGVRWGIGIRPGQWVFTDTVAPESDICFSCEADFELLAAKYQRFHDLGVRVLALSFDDVLKASSHPEDAERFGTGDAAYGHMNAYLASRLGARFPDALWLLRPAEYSGTNATAYLTALGEKLSPWGCGIRPKAEMGGGPPGAEGGGPPRRGAREQGDAAERPRSSSVVDRACPAAGAGASSVPTDRLIAHCCRRDGHEADRLEVYWDLDEALAAAGVA